MEKISIIVGIIIVVAGVIFAIRKFRKSKKEEGFASLLFTTGITLILTSTPATVDKFLVFIGIITKYENAQILAGTFNYYYFFTGILLVGMSIWLNIYSKKKIYVLNINGYMVKKLENYFKDLKMSNFEFKEREVDFVNIYKKMFAPTLNEDVFECIKEEIEEKVTAFKNESNGLKRGYTGIAPIPFIMYAGTFLEREVIDEYYEFDKVNTNTYYKLSKNKNVNTPKINVKTDIDSLNKSSKELVISISLTQQISEGDLSQFSNIEKVSIGIDNPQDNTIQNKEQLYEYRNFIVENIESISKEFSDLKTIHLIYSGQSCLPLEIGRRSIDSTRLPEIISYQYERQSNIKYPWGIVINGQSKGKLIKI